MAGKIKLNLLGGFQLLGRDATPLRVKLRKSEALLAYLACQRSMTATREHTANLLWGDYDEAKARQSLRQAVLDLKKAFQSEDECPIGLGREFISLSPGAFDVDALQFEALVNEASIESLKAAIDLYGGEFLFGFSVRASDFDGWLQATRNRYLDMLCRAALDYMHIVAGSSPALGIAAGKKAYRQDLLREDLLRDLMRLYVKVGRKSEALSVYHECADYLARELSTTPDERTLLLYQSISTGKSEGLPERLRADPLEASRREVLGKAEDFGALQSDATESLVIGREKELGLLRGEVEALSRGLGRVLFLFGEKGIGKSQLISALEEEVGSRFYTVRVTEQTRSLESVWPRLLEQLKPEQEESPNKPPMSPQSEAAEILREAAREAPLVVAFDGLHELQLTELEEFFLWARRVCNNRILLLVSWPAQSLGSYDEKDRLVEKIVPQNFAARLDVAGLSRSETDRLCSAFMSRLDLLPLSEEDRDWVWQVSGGNPKIALCVLTHWSDQEGAEGFHDHRLPTTLHEELHRQLAELDERYADLLAILALGGSTVASDLLERASKLPLDEYAARIKELLGQRVVVFSEDEEGREHFSFRLERMRIAFEEMIRPEQRRSYHRSIADAYLKGPARERELQAAKVAFHLRGCDDPHAAAAFALKAARLNLRRGRIGAAETIYRDQLEIAERALRIGLTEAEGLCDSCYLGLARVAEVKGFHDEVVQLSDRKYRRGGTEIEKGEMVVLRARALFALGDRDSALRAARNLKILGRNGQGWDAWLSADFILAALASQASYNAQRENDLAFELDFALKEGLLYDQVEIAGSLGIIALFKDDRVLARKLLERGVEAAEALASARMTAFCHFLRGLVGFSEGNGVEAESAFQEARRVAVSCGDLFRLYLIEGYKGCLLERQGRRKEAMDAFEQCRFLSSNFDAPPLNAAFFANWKRARDGRSFDWNDVLLVAACDNDAWATGDPQTLGTVKGRGSTSGKVSYSIDLRW